MEMVAVRVWKVSDDDVVVVVVVTENPSLPATAFFRMSLHAC